MTTTVTVKTHDWPVEVRLIEYHEHATGSYFGKRIEIVPPNAEKTINITQTQKATFTELPLPAQSAVQQAA